MEFFAKKDKTTLSRKLSKKVVKNCALGVGPGEKSNFVINIMEVFECHHQIQMDEILILDF